MPVPFEDPAKTDMRARCEIAIDQAGHELVATPVTIDLPDSAALVGRLKGDLQSLDAEGARYCYYLRPTANDVLPKWLLNLALTCHEILDVKLYIVAERPSPGFEKSCKRAGAGLVILTDDNEFEHVLDYDVTLPETVDAVFAERAAVLRRSMESKLHLNIDELQSRFERITELTQGMSEDIAEKYRQGVERQHHIWTAWGDQLSKELDIALSNRDQSMMHAIAAKVEVGPELDNQLES